MLNPSFEEILKMAASTPYTMMIYNHNGEVIRIIPFQEIPPFDFVSKLKLENGIKETVFSQILPQGPISQEKLEKYSAEMIFTIKFIKEYEDACRERGNEPY